MNIPVSTIKAPVQADITEPPNNVKSLAGTLEDSSLISRDTFIQVMTDIGYRTIPQIRAYDIEFPPLRKLAKTDSNPFEADADPVSLYMYESRKYKVLETQEEREIMILLDRMQKELMMLTLCQAPVLEAALMSLTEVVSSLENTGKLPAFFWPRKVTQQNTEQRKKYINDLNSILESSLSTLEEFEDHQDLLILGEVARQVALYSGLDFKAFVRHGRRECHSLYPNGLLKLYKESTGDDSSDLVELQRAVLSSYEEAVNRLCLHNLRLVISIAKKYRNKGVSFLDLIQQGNIGLKKAAYIYNPHEGNKFSTHATLWIKQSITRYLSEQSRSVRLPSHIIDQISAYKKFLRQNTSPDGRAPSDEDICKELNIDEEALLHLRKSMRNSASLDKPLGDDDGSIGDLIEDKRAISKLEETALPEEIKIQLIKSVKPHMDKQSWFFICLYFGLSGCVNLSFGLLAYLMDLKIYDIKYLEVNGYSKRSAALKKRISDKKYGEQTEANIKNIIGFSCKGEPLSDRLTLDSMGRALGITRERVRQILDVAKIFVVAAMGEQVKDYWEIEKSVSEDLEMSVISTIETRVKEERFAIAEALQNNKISKKTAQEGLGWEKGENFDSIIDHALLRITPKKLSQIDAVIEYDFGLIEDIQLWERIGSTNKKAGTSRLSRLKHEYGDLFEERRVAVLKHQRNLLMASVGFTDFSERVQEYLSLKEQIKKHGIATIQVDDDPNFIRALNVLYSSGKISFDDLTWMVSNNDTLLFLTRQSQFGILSSEFSLACPQIKPELPSLWEQAYLLFFKQELTPAHLLLLVEAQDMEDLVLELVVSFYGQDKNLPGKFRAIADPRITGIDPSFHEFFISAARCYRMRCIDIEDFALIYGHKIADYSFHTIKNIAKRWPERFEDLPKRIPTKNTLEKDIEMARKYKSGEENEESLQRYFGLSSIDSLRTKISSLKKRYPEAFEGMRSRRPAAQKSYDEHSITLAISWFAGEGYSADLQESFGLKSHRGLTNRVNAIRKAHPDRFEGLPKFAPRKKMKISEEQIQACVNYLKGNISRHELAPILGMVKVESIHQKVTELRMRFPEKFADAPEKRAPYSPPLQEISPEQIKAVVEYKKGNISGEELMRILAVGTKSGMLRKIQNICDRFPEAFTDVPQRRKRRKALNEVQRSQLIKFIDQEISMDELKVSFGIKTKNGMRIRLKSLKEFYPELFAQETSASS